MSQSLPEEEEGVTGERDDVDGFATEEFGAWAPEDGTEAVATMVGRLRKKNGGNRRDIQ